MSDREALEAAVEAEPGLFAATPTRLLTLRGGQRVKSYLGDYVARLDVPGQASDVLAVSDLPLRVDTPNGKRPVDLALTRRAGRFEPLAPLVDVSFPARLGDGVELADGVVMRVVGAAGDASGVQKGQQVFYANALTDADVFVTALPRGAESFVQLRSADSPRELSWQFDLPAGATLREVPGGGGMPSGAEIVRGDDTLARIWPPVAKDGADRPVGLTSRVEGSRFVLSVDAPADATYPILVDPIIERMFTNDDANNPNGTFADTLGWRREATRPLGDFDFSPATESVHGGPCLRIGGTPNPLPNTLCVGARPGFNYGQLSAAGWAWHPPAGLRTGADNLPAPNTDAYIFRADVRHSWLFVGGQTALYGGLISGRTQTFVGFNGPPPNLPASQNGGPGHAGQFTLPNASVGQGSNVSFFRTYCIESNCSEPSPSNDTYDGTFFSAGISAASVAAAVSTIQGAVLLVSDRTPPSAAHAASFDQSLWRRSGSVSSVVAAADAGVGLQQISVLYTGTAGQPVVQVVPGNPDNRCRGDRNDPCVKAFSQPFTYDTASMPEGVTTVRGLAVDALGKISPIDAGNAVTVKVDRTAPTVSSLTGTLADKADRAVKNGTYELTANVTDGTGRSGVRSITFKREDDTVIESFPITCDGADCPATAAATLGVQIDPTTFDAGLQRIKVVAEDAAGNAISDAAATVLRFVVDHDPPQITTVDHDPALTGWLGDRTLTATATATDDASGVKRFTLTTPNADGSTSSTDTVVSGCDDTIANACPTAASRDLSYSTAAMGDGPARPVSLTATDALDQTSSPPRQWTVDVDTASPELTLSGAAWDARDTYVGAGDLALQATAVDSVGGERRSGVASLSLQIDDQPAETRTRTQPCVTTTSEHCDLTESFTLQPAQLSTGTHTVKVTATDQADPANSTTTTFELHVDKQPPAITGVEHTPAPPQAWRDDVPRSVDVTAHDEHSGVASVALTLQGIGMPQVQTVDCAGSGAAPCPNDTTVSLSYATSGLPEGSSTASVHVRDKADNASEVSLWALRIDRTPPSADYSGSIHQANGGTLIGGSMDLRVDASDLFSGVREIRFLVDGQERQSKQGTCNEDGCATTLSDTFVMNASSYASGQRTLRVEISDRVGTPEQRHVTVKEYTVNNVAGSVSAPRQALGLERFWQYDSTPTGAGSAAHANLATGNLVWHTMPVVNRGRGLSSVVNVTYNSHDTTALLQNLPLNLRYQEMGRGFSLAISGLSRLNEPLAGVSLAGIPTVPNQIGLSDADGTRHTFNRIGGTTQYSHPPGVNLRLRRFTAPPLIVLPGANTSKTWAITRPDGTTFYYDANGYERSIVDRNGNTITFEYEIYLPPTGTVVGACPLLVVMDGIACAQRVRRVIDPAGRAIEIRYRPGTKRAGMIDRIIDHRFLTPGTRRTTRFIYDNNGYLKEIAEALTEGLQATPETRITKFEYTTHAGLSDQQLRRVVDPLGNATDIEYAAPNPPIQLLAGGGPPVRSITNRRAKKTSYEFGFFPDATRTRVVDALGRPTRYLLDASGRPTEKLDARETLTTLVWDGNHNVQQLTLAAGEPEEAVTKMTHNPNGMLLTRTDPESTESNPNVLTLTYRDGAGTQTTAVDANGVFVSDLTSITSPEGNTTTFGLDARGNTTSRTDGEGKTAHTAFDAFGQITRETTRSATSRPSATFTPPACPGSSPIRTATRLPTTQPTVAGSTGTTRSATRSR